MRWILVTLAAAIVCLGGMFAVTRWLNHQEDVARAPVIDYAAASAKSLTEPDAPFPPAPAVNYAAELDQIIPQLTDSDAGTRSAAADVLTSLPGDAQPAIEAAVKNSRLPEPALRELRRVQPIYKMRAAHEKAVRDEREASLAALLDAYEKYGHHDPKWDARARAAMTAFYRTGPTPYRTAAQEAWISKMLTKVVDDARCDDAGILYLYGCVIDEFRSNHLNSANDAGPSFQQAAAAGARDKWPDTWQAVFNARLLAQNEQFQLKIPDGSPARAGVEAWKGFVQAPWLSAATKERWVRLILANDMATARMAKAMGPLGLFAAKVDVPAEFAALHDVMEKAIPGIEPLLLTGEFYTDFAWDARGAGYANTVTEEGWLLMKERLDKAKEALQKAFDLDPGDGRAAADMIVACMGLSEDYRTTDRWFERAMAADPDNHDAAEAMLEYLKPKWHGTPEELLKFAESCRATHNYRARLPLAVAEACAELSNNVASPAQYLGDPQVWGDIRGVYESYLMIFPGDREQRTRYAKVAARAQKWKEANAQFDFLGDYPWPQVFWELAYDDVRNEASKASLAL